MANRPYKRQNYPDVNATDDELRRYFIDEFQRIETALTPGEEVDTIKLQQNPTGTSYNTGTSVPPYHIFQKCGNNDGWRLYGEGPAVNDVKMVFEILDDIETGDTWVFRNKRHYGSSPTVTEPFVVQGNGDLRATGSLTQNASDERLKENITLISNALDKVEQLRGVTFDWNDNVEEKGFRPTTKHETGVIAQDVQKVIPDAVVPAPFDEDYLTVKPEKIIPLLIEAIKELKAEVEELKGT